ncbi:MAG: hypothetical protein FWD34_06795 [Oscillospiraceae bacterium]|nr:hypothetical protein [Oscillospiraceae bacterium]
MARPEEHLFKKEEDITIINVEEEIINKEDEFLQPIEEDEDQFIYERNEYDFKLEELEEEKKEVVVSQKPVTKLSLEQEEQQLQKTIQKITYKMQQPYGDISVDPHPYEKVKEPDMSNKKKRRRAKKAKSLHPKLGDERTMVIHDKLKQTKVIDGGGSLLPYFLDSYKTDSKGRILEESREAKLSAEEQLKNAKSSPKNMEILVHGIIDDLMKVNYDPQVFHDKNSFFKNFDKFRKNAEQLERFEAMIKETGAKELLSKYPKTLMEIDYIQKRAKPYSDCYKACIQEFGITADGKATSNLKVIEIDDRKKYSLRSYKCDVFGEEQELAEKKYLEHEMNKSTRVSKYENLKTQVETNYKTVEESLKKLKTEEEKNQFLTELKETDNQTYIDYFTFQKTTRVDYSIEGSENKLPEPIFRRGVTGIDKYKVSWSEEEYKEIYYNLGATVETAGSLEEAQKRNIAGLKKLKEAIKTLYMNAVERYGTSIENMDIMTAIENYPEMMSNVDTNQVDERLTRLIPEIWDYESEDDQILKNLINYHAYMAECIPAYIQMMDESTTPYDVHRNLRNIRQSDKTFSESAAFLEEKGILKYKTPIFEKKVGDK